MIIDSIKIDDLPSGKEEAFVEYDRRLRAQLSDLVSKDENRYYDEDGFYRGDYQPQRFYVSSVVAFLDEYELESESIVDISLVKKSEFSEKFSEFFNQVNYVISRYQLRAGRMKSGAVGTPIEIEVSFKDEIGKLLSTIRKIVNQEVKDVNKKEEIFKKIASLQSEVDRDRTTVDAVFSRLMALSRGANEVAEKSDPLLEKVERLKEIFFKSKVDKSQLPESKRKKALPAPEEGFSPDLDNEIPF